MFERVSDKAQEAQEREIAAMAKLYVRERHLHRIISCKQDWLRGNLDDTRAEVVQALSDAVAKHLKLGEENHWVFTYRHHKNLVVALRAETEALQRQVERKYPEGGAK